MLLGRGSRVFVQAETRDPALVFLHRSGQRVRNARILFCSTKESFLFSLLTEGMHLRFKISMQHDSSRHETEYLLDR